MLVKYAVVFLLINLYNTGTALAETYWQGNWFPVDPGADDINDDVDKTILARLADQNDRGGKVDLTDEKHGIKMGIVDKSCDDAKTNLSLDWDGSSVYYTCFQSRYKSSYRIKPIKSCDHIPKGYWAGHICMNRTIDYYHIIPTFGNHRPLWPKYGEYEYVPEQRWLHNLEHGGIVMLYHPCADKKQVAKLKDILRNCMARHIITPFIYLTEDRPLALLSWGCRFLMNTVNLGKVVEFIVTHGMKGPEKKYGNGQYSLGLIQSAQIVYDKNDTVLCPNYL